MKLLPFRPVPRFEVSAEFSAHGEFTRVLVARPTTVALFSRDGQGGLVEIGVPAGTVLWIRKPKGERG